MWFWTLGVIFLVLVSVSASEIPSCPPREDIYPCTCYKDYTETAIECEKINGIDKLYPVLKSTRGLNISYSFWNSKLGDIPSDFFEGQKSVSIHFEDCEIGSFGDRPFTGLENTLRSLYIHGCVDKRKKDLKTLPVSHLKKLDYFVFEGNDIKKLGNEWFDGGPEALRTVMLEANDIEELGDRAFASLVNLHQIWLGDNRFGRVYRSMFPRPASKLELLEFSFNGVEELPKDIFEDMPVLSSINVSGNKLESVPEAVWGKIWGQLNEVYVQRNAGFKCDERLKWIYKRKLPKIFIGECTRGKFAGKKLSELKLADFD